MQWYIHVWMFLPVVSSSHIGYSSTLTNDFYTNFFSQNYIADQEVGFCSQKLLDWLEKAAAADLEMNRQYLASTNHSDPHKTEDVLQQARDILGSKKKGKRGRYVYVLTREKNSFFYPEAARTFKQMNKCHQDSGIISMCMT